VFNFSVSMSAGYTGGFIFPLISIGVIAGEKIFPTSPFFPVHYVYRVITSTGTVCHLKYPYIPYGMCVATFMVALPSGSNRLLGMLINYCKQYCMLLLPHHFCHYHMIGMGEWASYPLRQKKSHFFLLVYTLTLPLLSSCVIPLPS
jgi:hypothetical protein